MTVVRIGEEPTTVGAQQSIIAGSDPSKWLIWRVRRGAHRGKWFVFKPGPGIPVAEFMTGAEAHAAFEQWIGAKHNAGE